MQRKALTLAFLAAGSLGFAQDAPAKFSFKAPAGRVSAVFPELSKAINMPITAAGPVAYDVILLNLSDVSPNDAMTKIAETLHAEWSKNGNTWVLTRSSALEVGDQKAEIAEKVAQFKSALEKTLSVQREQGVFNDAAAKKLAETNKKMMEDMGRQASSGGAIRFSTSMGSIGNQTPSARAIANILSKMSDAQIAALCTGKRVVFSLNPTRMQVGLPSASNQILRTYIQELAIYKNANNRATPGAGQGPERQFVINGFGADQGGEGDPKLGIGYAILYTQPGRSGGNPNLNLIVADPNGKTLGTGQFSVGAFNPPTQAPVTLPTTTEKPIPLTDLTKEMAKLIGPGMGGAVAGMRMTSVAISLGDNGSTSFMINGGDTSKTPKLSDELKAKVLQPEMYDPLSFAPGELWSGAADAKGEDLVAYLPDSSFIPLTQLAATGTVTPSALINAAKTRARLKVVEQGGWLLVSPEAPVAARAEVINRLALGNALKLIDKQGFMNLDSWSTFAFNQAKAPRMGDFDDQYIRFINTSVAEELMSAYSFNGGWDTLRFYASLGTAQKQALNNNGRISLGTLSAFQMGIVSEQVFNSFDGPNVTNRAQSERVTRFVMGGNSVTTERTYLLPNGINRDGWLNLNLQNKEVVQAQNSQTGGQRFLEAAGLAFDRMRTQSPELASFSNSAPFDQFRMGTQRSIRFQFLFTPELSLTRQLEDNSPSNRPFVPYEQLPDAFRKAVDQQIEQMKKNFGSGGGGQAPPPKA